MLEGSFGYTDGKFMGYDVGIILISIDGKVLFTILGNVDIITLGIYVETEMVSLD